MKTLVRNAVADMMHLSGVSAVLRRVKGRSLAILCYHRVLPSEARAECPFRELAVTPEAFERHVEYCRRHYDSLPLREAVDHLRSDTRGRRPLLAFTFDDGYADNFEYARPVLNAYGVRATFFVISSLVGTGAPPWPDRLSRALTHLRNTPSSISGQGANSGDTAEERLVEQYHNRRRRAISQLVNGAKILDPHTRAAMVEQLSRAAVKHGWNGDRRDRIMTKEELMQLVGDGHEVASHTRSHPILTQLSPEEVAGELGGARSDLTALTGEMVTSFAYPNGDHNDDVVTAARRAGYRCAVTTRYGLNDASADPLRLRRVFISQARLSRAGGDCSTNILALELTGAAEAVFLRRYRRSNAP